VAHVLERMGSRSLGRSLPAACATLLGALLLAAPAQAAPDWELGLPEETTEESCFSLANPDLVIYETNVSARAGMLIDKQSLPRVGDVFYGAVWIGQVRGCFQDSVAPEVLPPAGVELAVSGQNPVRCHYTPPGGAQTPISPAEGCPQNPGPGNYGGSSLAPNGDRANVWQLGEGEIFMIEFPLRASRPLTGLPGGPSCPQRAQRTGACPREAAGDFLQTPIKVLDNGFSPVLTPALGLFAVGGGAGAPDGAPAPGGKLIAAPRSVRIRRALRGIRITVSVASDGSTVKAVLRARGLRGVRGGLIASAVRTRANAGALRLRLKPTRAAARALRGKRKVRATLRVTVKPRSGATQSATARMTLRR
jgi:hypothetical protein